MCGYSTQLLRPNLNCSGLVSSSLARQTIFSCVGIALPSKQFLAVCGVTGLPSKCRLNKLPKSVGLGLMPLADIAIARRVAN